MCVRDKAVKYECICMCLISSTPYKKKKKGPEVSVVYSKITNYNDNEICDTMVLSLPMGMVNIYTIYIKTFIKSILHLTLQNNMNY